MSCPSNVTPNSFLMDSLAGSCRGENYSSSPGMYMQSGNDFSCGMMRNCGIVPSLSKRDEVNNPSLSLNSYPSYLSQLDNWCDPKNTYRIEQPVARQLSSCSFPTNVKEENVCCMYSADKRAKNATEAALYPNQMPTDHEVPVPSYYRAGQGYSMDKGQGHPATAAADFEATFDNRTTSLNPRSEILEQQQQQAPGGKVGGFPENTKTDSQSLATNLSTNPGGASSGDIKTEKSLPAAKLAPPEADKEMGKNTDTSTDNSDNEGKGKPTCACCRNALPGHPGIP